FFRSLKPYKAGNGLLWALNKVCTVDKHHMLTPLGLGARVTNLVTNLVLESRDIPFGNRDKNEIVYAITGPDETVEYKAEILLGIAFGEIDIVKNQPVVRVLDDFSRIVNRILLGLEAESRRLGYIK
ncbi:MAG TPA: hypothetical protein VK463_10205, partial [Desulfomonilaceae bacterium]|nr:hypothetical protein [Desulfomonilaceae bacterium]